MRFWTMWFDENLWVFTVFFTVWMEILRDAALLIAIPYFQQNLLLSFTRKFDVRYVIISRMSWAIYKKFNLKTNIFTALKCVFGSQRMSTSKWNVVNTGKHRGKQQTIHEFWTKQHPVCLGCFCYFPTILLLLHIAGVDDVFEQTFRFGNKFGWVLIHVYLQNRIHFLQVVRKTDTNESEKKKNH